MTILRHMVIHMKFLRVCFWVAIVASCLAPLGQSQEREDVALGFQAFIVYEPKYAGGAKLDTITASGFKAFIDYDQKPVSEQARDIRNRSGRMQDLVSEHGLNPVLAVFAKTVPPGDPGSPMVALLKKQDEIATNYYHRRLGAFTVFLALKNIFREDDRDNTRDARLKEIARFTTGAAPKRTTISLAEATVAPKGESPKVPNQVAKMGIADADDVVIVLYHRLEVVKRWKFPAGTPPTQATLDEIGAEVEKLLGKPKPPAPTKE